MSDWIDFEARIEPMQWGETTYTVLPLPDDVADALARCKARRVDVELNDHPYNLAVTKSPALSSPFLYTGKRILKEIGAAPGEVLEIRLRPADENDVDIPSDVLKALKSGQKSAVWGALTPGKQRGLLHPITTAKRPETRASRIATLVASL